MPSRLRRVYFGWWIVSTAFVLNAVTGGVYYLGFTVFFLPLSRDLHVSRTAASLPFTLSRLTSVVTFPAAGWASDRFGPPRVVIIGGLLAGLGYLLLQVSHSYLVFLLVFVFAITTGIQLGYETPGLVAVSRWFTRGRSMAFAVASVGFSVGGTVIVPLIALGVDRIGWRTTALIAGIVLWTLVPITSTMLRHSPREDGPAGGRVRNDGEESQTPSARTTQGSHYTLQEALRTRAFWFIIISYGLRTAVWDAVGVHLVPIMVWKGLRESTAGLMVGVYALHTIPQKLLLGRLADKWSTTRLAASAAFISSTGFIILALLSHAEPWHIVLIFALLATSDASWPLAWSILTEQFGLKSFGTTRGFMMAATSAMGLGAPLYSGWVFDTTESYFWVVAPAAGLLILAGVLNWLTAPPGLAQTADDGGISRMPPTASAVRQAAPRGSTRPID